MTDVTVTNTAVTDTTTPVEDPATDVPPPQAIKIRSNSVADTDCREGMVNDDILLFEAWFEVMDKNEKGKVNVEGMVNDDILLFEAWFEVMDKNEKGKVNVEKLVDKVSTSGLFTFNSTATTLVRRIEEKTVKEELLDLIEEDLSLNVLGWISIDQFFRVIVRFPRYLHRLKRAAGDESNAPTVWEKPAPLTAADTIDDEDDDILDDPFETPEVDQTAEKQLKRLSWRNSFKELFVKSDKVNKKKKKNPKRLSKQSSSFYEKCRSIRLAFLGKTSTVKVFLKEGEEEDEE